MHCQATRLFETPLAKCVCTLFLKCSFMNKDALLATVPSMVLAISPTGTDLIKYAVGNKTAFQHQRIRGLNINEMWFGVKYQ